MSDLHVSSAARQLQHLVALAAAESLPDAALLERFVGRRDEDAFAGLVRRHGPMVLRVCRRIVGCDAQAADCFQATFLVLVRRAASIRDPATLANWLYGVAFRVARDARVRMHREAGHEARERPAPSADPVHQAAWRELGAIIEDEVGSLPDKLRLPILLCYWQGQTNAEAARQLGWPAGTVKTRLARARRLLHDRLVLRGVTMPVGAITLLLMPAGADAVLPAALVSVALRALGGSASCPSGSVTVGAAELAHAVLQAGPLTKAKLALALMLSVALGLSAWGAAGLSSPPQADEPRAELQPLAVAAQVPKAGNVPPRNDLYGDPLPVGAIARLGTLRFRHEGEAFALAFAQNDKVLIGHTRSGVLVWDAHSGKVLHRLSRENVSLNPGGLGVSPDGAILAVSGPIVSMQGKAGITFWDINTGKMVQTLALPGRDFRAPPGARPPALRFSPNGKVIAITDMDDIHVFDLTTRKVAMTLKNQNRNSLDTLAFTPDSNMLAGAGSGPLVKLWDLRTGKPVRDCDTDSKFVLAVAFSSDGAMLAAGSRNHIALFDPRTGKLLGQLTAEMDAVLDLAFTPDGKTLVSGAEDAKVRIWDVASRKVRHTLDGRQFVGRSLTLSRDGKTVALGSANNAVRLWDVTTGKELFTEHEGHDAQINCLLFSPDGKTLFSGGYNQQIRLWDTATWKPAGLYKGSAETLSLSADGKRLASVPYNKTVRLWDVSSGKESLLITVPDTDRVLNAYFEGDGKTLLTSDHKNGQERTSNGTVRLRRWDAADGKMLRELVLPETRLESLALVPGGKYAVFGSWPGLLFYDVEEGREHLRLVGPKYFADALAISPDGRVVFSGANDGAAHAWEVISGQEILTLKIGQRSVAALAVAPTGRVLAAAGGFRPFYIGEVGNEPSFRLWDLATGHEVARFDGLGSSVRVLAFSPDGAFLAAALADSTILVWPVPEAVRHPRLSPKHLTAGELDSLWAELAGADAAKAYRAAWALAAAPAQTVALLRDRLKPALRADGKLVARWIAELSSDQFETRDVAVKELERLGAQIEPALKQALKDGVALETQRRVEGLLKTIHGVPPMETLRKLRAVSVLEWAGTPETRPVLEAVAAGAPAALETRDARGALERLKKQPAIAAGR